MEEIDKPHKALHLTAIPLRFIVAGDLVVGSLRKTVHKNTRIFR